MELVVESNNPAMINARYDFYIFNSEYKQDVINYFEKRFSKEYAIIKEKEIQEERQKQAELKRPYRGIGSGHRGNQEKTGRKG